MALRKISLKTTLDHRGKRLDHILAELLPNALGQPISKGKVRKLIVAGAVYLNGKRVRIASKELMPNAKLEAYVDLEKLASDGRSKDQPFTMTERDVLFEDDYLIAVNKPPGLPTQPTLDEARDNLFAAVKKFLAARGGSAQPYLGLHHRLDRDTSGVVLFTKHTDANVGVSELFTKHLAQKRYFALTRKPPGGLVPAWTVKNFLGKSKDMGKRTRFQSVRSGGDAAHTDFRLIEQGAKALWVEAFPRTGRTHQIRVHLSEDEMPILGDPTYGPRSALPGIEVPRLMLHAVSLTFRHPIHQTEISVSSPLPEDFTACLRALQLHPGKAVS